MIASMASGVLVAIPLSGIVRASVSSAVLMSVPCKNQTYY